MRLRLTESQYEKLRLLKESEEVIEKFKNLCAQKAAEVDKLYLLVVNSTVIEFINGSIDARKIDDKVNEIEDIIFKEKKRIMGMHDSGLVGQGIEDFDMIIYDIMDTVNNKVAAFSLYILNYLGDMQIKLEERASSFKQYFSDVKPMDIQSFE